MRKAPVLREALDRLPQAQDILLGFHVVPIDRGRTLPQRLIELNLPKDVESMGDCKAQGMEAPQFLHAPIQVSHAVRIAGSCAFQILCNLVPILRIDVNRIVTEAMAAYGSEDLGLLLPVYQLICTFSGDAHYVFNAFD